MTRREKILYILDVKSSQRCGTERCENFSRCNECLADQIEGEVNKDGKA